MIDKIITLLRQETPYKYYFNATPLKDDYSVIYNYNLSSDDGIKQCWRLELRIIGKGITEKTLVKIEQMRNKINAAVITIADNKLINNIYRCTANGGGSMTDENSKTVHQFMYYDVLLKK